MKNITLTYAELRKLQHAHREPKDQIEALLLQGIDLEIGRREHPMGHLFEVPENPDRIGHEKPSTYLVRNLRR